MKTTACPMDCFDSCEVIYDNGVCKPSKTHPITRGSLCKPFAYLTKEKNIKDENLEDTLKNVKEVLSQKDKKILYYKGTGNIGVLQNTPKIFFEKIKATIAVGSNCEGAGEAGIEWGRKYTVNPNIEELLNSEVIVVWGRNLTVTSNHIYKLIKDKIFITIDPHRTKIAKQSKEYFPIPPKGDYAFIQELMKALDNKTLDKSILQKLNTTQEQIQNFLNLLKGKKISFLLGVGFQKYKQGAQITHEIDKFASNFNVFDGINKGVWYLGDSSYPYDNKIALNPTNTDIYPSVDFASYDIVFIQGANPVVSAPNTQKVINGLEKSFVIYMGTTFNDTAKYANIIIPAKTFLQKDDCKVSYGHDEVVFTQICEQTNDAISEYDFTKYMFDSMDLEGLLTKEQYLDGFRQKIKEKPSIKFIKHEVLKIQMLDIKDDEFYLLTSKYENTINSQFKYSAYVFVHPSNNFKDEQIISISSKYGKIKAKVKNDFDVNKKSLLFYAGHKDVNYLTPDTPSDMGDNAIFQDVILKVEYETIWKSHIST